MKNALPYDFPYVFRFEPLSLVSYSSLALCSGFDDAPVAGGVLVIITFYPKSL